MAPAKAQGAVLTGASVTTMEVTDTIPTEGPAGGATPIPAEPTLGKTELFGRCLRTA